MCLVVAIEKHLYFPLLIPPPVFMLLFLGSFSTFRSLLEVQGSQCTIIFMAKINESNVRIYNSIIKEKMQME